MSCRRGLLGANTLLVIGGCAMAGEKEPIRSLERIRVFENSDRTIRILSENCGQLAVARRSPSVFLQNNESILVAGGILSKKNGEKNIQISCCLGPNEHTNSIEILIKTGEIWESEMSKWTCEESHSCATFDPIYSTERKIIFGGFDAHNCLSTVQVLENGGESRRVNGLLPRLKNSATLQVSDHEFILFGGWEDEKETSAVIRRLKFDPKFESYEVIFDGFLPYPIEGHSIIRNGSNIFLIGGFDGCFVCSTIIRYSLEDKKSEILDVKLKEKRENHVSAVLSGKYLLVAGGWNSRQAMDSIEAFELLTEPPYLKTCEISKNENLPRLKVPRNRPAGLAI